MTNPLCYLHDRCSVEGGVSGAGLFCGTYFTVSTIVSIMPRTLDNFSNAKLGAITWDMILVGLGGLFVTLITPILIKIGNDTYDKKIKPKLFPEKKEEKDTDVVAEKN